ncbi:adenosylcobyric acid synthase [Lentibacillus persicus]|uniref:Cobyric acid synthase n=1 Tax=Lentibacillus persicus TaxID=640948 RepID=A0A1I1S2J0_9BACI|nr:cobyric acid synthase [Lentibacillus persicus]SFD40741.1 adenosylcobyric acid synthase [Lentibacillus persicus]
MKGVMIQGTASNVGKSLITTALCRLFSEKGYAAAPFKAQNMSNRTIQTEDGKEMSVAQAQQAEAAGLSPRAYMNPVVLKPSANHQTEVIFMGEGINAIDGNNYQMTYYNDAKQTIQSALEQLDRKHDLIFAEGAGSPVEMNLKAHDLANMAVAEMADVPVVLVTDIDRGGAFASVAGTLALLAEEERNRVKGLVINKFHGDVTSFASGSEWLEAYTGIPVLGVIPHIEHDLAEEDGFRTQEPSTDSAREKESTYDRLARHVEHYVDCQKLTAIVFGESHVH